MIKGVRNSNMIRVRKKIIRIFEDYQNFEILLELRKDQN